MDEIKIAMSFLLHSVFFIAIAGLIAIFVFFLLTLKKYSNDLAKAENLLEEEKTKNDIAKKVSDDKDIIIELIHYEDDIVYGLVDTDSAFKYLDSILPRIGEIKDGDDHKIGMDQYRHLMTLLLVDKFPKNKKEDTTSEKVTKIPKTQPEKIEAKKDNVKKQDTLQDIEKDYTKFITDVDISFDLIIYNKAVSSLYARALALPECSEVDQASLLCKISKLIKDRAKYENDIEEEESEPVPTSIMGGSTPNKTDALIAKSIASAPKNKVHFQRHHMGRAQRRVQK